MPAPRLFISYSHDSGAHRDFVLSLSNRLRADGLDCQIDQYINGFPPEGWQRWMEAQVEEADFVLLSIALERIAPLPPSAGERAGVRGGEQCHALPPSPTLPPQGREGRQAHLVDLCHV